MKEDKRVFVEILKLVRLLAVIVFVVGVCLFVKARYENTKEPELTSSFVNGKLESVSDLTTAQLSYTGLIKYSEGSIPYLTQNSFSMLYTANVRAGIDLSKAEITITEDRVFITLPECEVQSVDVDTDSIEFYDEHWALFNRVEKTDVIDTVSAAKEDVAQKADIESLLEHASLQTKAIIEGILKDSIGDRELVFE